MLIDELQAAGGNKPEFSPTEIEKLEEAGSDEGDWEDDPDTLDLGLGSTKQGMKRIPSIRDLTGLNFGTDLMAFAEERPYAGRQRDDETQAYLIQFFHDAATKPGFAEVFSALSSEEQEKLRSYG